MQLKKIAGNINNYFTFWIFHLFVIWQMQWPFSFMNENDPSLLSSIFLSLVLLKDLLCLDPDLSSLPVDEFLCWIGEA